MGDLQDFVEARSSVVPVSLLDIAAGQQHLGVDDPQVAVTSVALGNALSSVQSGQLVLLLLQVESAEFVVRVSALFQSPRSLQSVEYLLRFFPKRNTQSREEMNLCENLAKALGLLVIDKLVLELLHDRIVRRLPADLVAEHLVDSLQLVVLVLLVVESLHVEQRGADEVVEQLEVMVLVRNDVSGPGVAEDFQLLGHFQHLLGVHLPDAVVHHAEHVLYDL